MKGRSSLVLLIAILVLGGFIFAQHIWRAKVPSKELRRITLFDLDVDALVSLEFQRTNQLIRCVKENGVWMTGGSGQGLGRADIALVHGMVMGLNSFGKGTTITAEQLQLRGFDESEYGFAPPALRITAIDNRGRHVWLVGREGSLGNILYVKTEGEEDIYTVPTALKSFVPLEADQLRDRVAFAADLAGSRHLEIRRPEGFVQIVKGAKGGWQLQQPLVAKADDGEVEAFLKQLQEMRIEGFEADAVSDFSVYGLQNDMRQISIGGADGTSRMLVFGDEIPDSPGFIYARRTDDATVFSLEKKVLDLLLFEENHFRDRRVLTIDAREVDLISIIHGMEQLDLAETESGKWAVVAPVSWEANLRSVDDLLVEWNDAVVVDFDDADSDEAPEWTYIFGSSTLGLTNTLDVLPSHGREDGIRIRRNGEKTVYQLNLKQAPDDATNPLKFKDRLVWRFDLDDIQRLSVARRNNGEHVVERQEDGIFISGGTNGAVQVNSAVLEEMLGGVRQLVASSYITYDPRDLSRYGLDKPFLSLHVGLKGTNQLGRVLFVGDETERGYYAMVQGRDVVFLLENGIVDAFSKSLFSDQEIALPDAK